MSGNPVAKIRVELVKTNPTFLFVGRIDLPSSIKIHGAVALALSVGKGSVCRAWDVLLSAG